MMQSKTHPATRAIGGETRRLLLVSSALATLSLAVPAHGFAQSTGGAPAVGSAHSGAIEDIVVTAEKRTSTAQRTAAALTVVGGETLQRQQIVQFRDLNSVLLNVQVVPVANSLQFAVRGLGSSFIDPRADPAAAVSINGLYFTRALPGGIGFLDVARVEALAGPQGTLYGRNAAAGAINIVTNPPTNKFSGMLQGTYGSLNENDVTAVLNVPITDNFWVRGAYERDRRDGYVGHYFNDVQSDTGRIEAKWTPTADLTVFAESDLIELGGHGNVAEGYPCAGTIPFSLYLPVNCSVFGVALTTPKIGHTSTFVDSDQLHIDYNLGAVTLTSISGYVGNHLQYQNLPNGPYFTVHEETNNHDFTEELRLSGHDSASHQGGLAWQVGTFLFHSTGSEFSAISLPGPPDHFTSIPQHSEAGFAQATYGVTNSLRVTAGIRYTHDYKGIGQPTPEIVSTDNKVSYKVGVEYDVARGNLLYATVSTGYVAGGPNAGDPTLPVLPGQSPLTFAPETITAYELGTKNRFLNNRLQVNADLYYYDFKNYQIVEPAVLNTGIEALTLENGGNVTTYGAELNGIFALTPDDRLSASLAYAEGHFGVLHYPFAILTPNGYIPGQANVAAGSSLINLPKWVALLGYDHTIDFRNGGSLVFAINSKLSTQYLLVVGSTDRSDRQKDFTMTDASLAYHFPGDRWVLRGWIKNIENAAVNTYGQTLALHNYGVLPPRTYGVTASVNF